MIPLWISYCVNAVTCCCLREHYGRLQFKSDLAKKEQLVINSAKLSLSEFLDVYNETQNYIVDQLPTEMRGEMPLVDCLRCGGFTTRLQEMLLWFSSGNTTSSFHFDTFDNLNCQIDGTKHWFLIDKQVRYRFVSPCKSDD